jgi:hypothetical protein
MKYSLPAPRTSRLCLHGPGCRTPGGESRAKLTSQHRALAIFAGDRGFESISLQQRVCELSVPERRKALNERVIVNENGGRRRITMRQAIIKQLVKRSATADLRAIKILLDMVWRIEGQTEPDSAEAANLH